MPLSGINQTPDTPSLLGNPYSKSCASQPGSPRVSGLIESKKNEERFSLLGLVPASIVATSPFRNPASVLHPRLPFSSPSYSDYPSGRLSPVTEFYSIGTNLDRPHSPIVPTSAPKNSAGIPVPKLTSHLRSPRRRPVLQDRCCVVCLDCRVICSKIDVMGNGPIKARPLTM
jgi:hypothetical protein